MDGRDDSVRERLDKQFAFIREIDKEKQIGRQTYLADASRKETDAEHAWHMAMMTLILSEYAREKIDVGRTMALCLAHDLIEIYAGDTYAYDTKGNEDKAERERAAADKLFALLPEDQAAAIRGLWEEFEERLTPEAKFADTMDKIQPLLLNHVSGGRSWKEHGVLREQPYKRNEKTHEGSQILWDYAEEFFLRPHVGKELK
ncbi:MAG: HD domain-containing protein [Lachnospiraceae bacterium]|nr:HD domain-containing protein [Lachnospiraceae bacterium]